VVLGGRRGALGRDPVAESQQRSANSAFIMRSITISAFIAAELTRAAAVKALMVMDKSAAGG